MEMSGPKKMLLLLPVVFVSHCSQWRQVDSVIFTEVLRRTFSIEISESAVVHSGGNRFNRNLYRAKVKISDDFLKSVLNHEFAAHEPVEYYAQRTPQEFDWYQFEGDATRMTIAVPATYREALTSSTGEVYEFYNVLRIVIFEDEGFAFVELVLEGA